MLSSEKDFIGKIDAIKFVRKLTDLGLVDAKHLVEHIAGGAGYVTLETLGDFFMSIRGRTLICIEGDFYVRLEE